MNTAMLVVHAGLTFGSLSYGYIYCYKKKKDRDMALFIAGLQPSIAIALSLAGLSSTFGEFSNGVLAEGMYSALADKMIHMVVGISFGAIAEGLTETFLPSKSEESTNNAIKDAVTQSMKREIEVLNDGIAKAGEIIKSAPEEIEKANLRLIAESAKHTEESVKRFQAETAKITLATVDKVSTNLVAVNKSIEGLNKDVRLAAENAVSQTRVIKDELGKSISNDFNAVKQEMNFVTKKFSEDVKLQSEEAAKVAAEQGQKVIEQAAQVIANNMTGVVSRVLSASEKLESAATKAESNISKLSLG